MKKWLFPLFLIPSLAWAERLSTELRVGYFYPASHDVRKIYKNGGVEFEAEAAARLFCDLNLWVNFNYFQRHGHAMGFPQHTSIRIYPLSAGLKYNFPIFCNFYFYLGAGASYTWVRIHDRPVSSELHTHFSKQNWGGVGKAGFLYCFCNCLFLDIFADYYYTKISHGPHSLNIGGLRTGGGLGVRF
jgi:outer membrane protein W